MKISAALASLVAAGFLALPLGATEPERVEDLWLADRSRIFEASEVTLEHLQWIARPLVVFANSPRDPDFIDQMEEITDGLERLAERDVIVIVDTDPRGGSDLRTKLRPRGFMLVLIGKDGQIALRKPLPWTVREVSRSIDKMPLRQREIHEGRIDG